MAVASDQHTDDRDALPQRVLHRLNPTVIGTVLAALFALPILALFALALSGDREYLDHIASTRLIEFSFKSAQLAILSGSIAALIGVCCAWLVTRYEFAGRRALGWLLILPLAMPGYVAAYSWYAITAPGSKFEHFMRGTVGAGGPPVKIFAEREWLGPANRIRCFGCSVCFCADAISLRLSTQPKRDGSSRTFDLGRGAKLGRGSMGRFS